jgi:competence protein ComEA
MTSIHLQAMTRRKTGAALLALLAGASFYLTAHAATAAAPAMPAASAPTNALGPPDKKPSPASRHLVDINSASRKELKTLPGIGDAEADKIIAGRPYLTKTELVSKGALQTGPFLSVRHLVVAMPTRETKAKLAAKH